MKNVLKIATTTPDQVLAVNLQPEGFVLPLSVPSALTVGTTAEVVVEKADPLPSLEHGVTKADLQEFFLGKGAACVGVVQTRRKEDGSWNASLQKSNLPYLLSDASREDPDLAQLTKSAHLPSSLVRVIPEKFQYWKGATDEERVQRHGALLRSGLVNERLIKVVDGELRLCTEKLFLYEPDEAQGAMLAAKSEVRKSLSEVVRSFTPVSKEYASAMREDGNLRANTSRIAKNAIALFSAPENVPVEKALDALKAHATAYGGDWLLEAENNAENVAKAAAFGRPFYVEGTQENLFVASFEPRLIPGLRFCEVEKAQWTTKYVNDLPDSAFLYIAPGGKKDASGKTEPRANRYFPVRDASGKPDLPHLRNALARVSQAKIPASAKEKVRSAAEKLLAKTEKARVRKDAVVKECALHGITIKIDRPKGFVQRGTDAKGNNWERTYKNDYGFVPSTNGGDEEELDVYLGGATAPTPVFWIEQQKDDGTFDEWKVMLGFESEEEAKACYKAHTPEKFLKAMHEVPLGAMQSLLNCPTVIPPSAIEKASVGSVSKQFDVARFLVAKNEVPAEERYVLGIVLEPEVVDSQGEIYNADEIRKTAHGFMEHYRAIGLQHEGLVSDKVKILESFLAPTDYDVDGQPVKKGSWVLAVHVLDDGLWARVKEGSLTGFSIGGTAVKEKLE